MLLNERYSFEQDHKGKLLGVTLVKQITWLGHIDMIIAKIGRLMSVLFTDSLLNQTGYTVQSLVLCHLDHYLVV